MIVLVLGHFGQGIVSLEYGQRLAEVLQCFGLEKIEGIRHAFHILTDRIEWQVPFVQITAQVVQSLLLRRASYTL